MSTSVAVVGLGAVGMVAVKNLVEEGFEVTAFDRNDYIGGLWKYTEEEKTSVLPSTIVNISKERGCFTDFPFQDEASSYPTSAQVQQYLVDYCTHFDLHKHFRLGSPVIAVTQDQERQKWVVRLQGGKEQSFDKVVIATGMNAIPKIPMVPGLDQFGGQVMHSQSFKRPSDFKGRSVLVVGFANTAADTATELVGHAKDIYIAHRQGNTIMARHLDGKPIDHSLTIRLIGTQNFMNNHFPNLAESLFNKFAKDLQDKQFKIRPEWNLSPTPSLKQSVPIISDHLIDRLESGDIKSVSALQKVTGRNTVKLVDGTSLTVDTIIWCTGYKTDFSLVGEDYDPTRSTTAAWAASPGSNDKPLPRLYQNVFSLKEPHSLAFLGAAAFTSPAFQLYDLASMAIAQIWKGASSLPSQAEMEQAVDAHHEWVVSLAQRGSVYPGIVKPGPWMSWVNDAAGTGVNEMLAYGAAGWAFWWRDRTFCNLLMDGIYSPHIFRVFDGKRKKWDGAREAIEKANQSRH